MAYQTSTLRLAVDSSGAINQVNKLEKKLVSMRTLALAAGGGLAAIGAVGGIKDGFSKAITTIANFEERMAALRAVTKATEQDMKAMSDQARELGATTSFGADQAAQAQLFLAQAGLSTNQVLAATPAALQLAKAGMLELGEAADLTTDIMAQMGLGVEDFTRINDVLLSTAQSATTDVRQLGEAFSYAGPLAKSAGVSLEETSAALGVISSGGIKASRAGTGLLGFIRQLTNLTPSATESLQQYGIATEDVDIKTLGLAKVIDNLAPIAGDTGAAMKVFGSEAGAAALTLINGSSAYDELSEKLGDVEGAAAEAAKTMGESLTSSFKGLSSAAQESALQMGDKGLTAALTGLIDTATGVIQVWNGMEDQFLEGRDDAEDMRDRIGALSTGIEVLATMLAARLGGALLASTGKFVAAQVAAARYAVSLNAVTASSTAAAVRITAMGAAARTAGSAMALIGGPAGVAILAAAAVWQLHDAMDNSESRAIELDSAVGELTKGIQGLTKAQLENKKAEFLSTLLEQQKQATQIARDISALSEQMNIEDVMFQGRPGAARTAITGAVGDGGLSGQLEDTLFQVEATTNAIGLLDDQLAAVTKSGEGAGGGAKDLNDKVIRLTDSQKLLNKAMGTAQTLFESLRAEFDPLGTATDDYLSKQAQLKLLLDQGAISAEQYRQAVILLSQQLREGLAEGDLSGGFMGQVSTGGVASGQDPLSSKNQQQDPWEQWLSSAETAFTDFESLSATAAQNFTTSFGQAFASAVTDSENFGDAALGVMSSLSTAVIQALGEMAAQWLVYKAVQMFAQESSQQSGVTQMTANAMAMQQMAALNAYSSAAAVPQTGYLMAPAAAQAAYAATTPYVAGVTAASLSGMAHDGIDSVPNEGTWLLDRGERVVDSRTNEDLKMFLASANNMQQSVSSSAGSGETTYHIEMNAPVTVQSRGDQSTENAQKQGAEIAKTMKAIVLKTLEEQKRPGGSLASVRK